MKIKESDLLVEILMPENSGDFAKYMDAVASAAVRVTQVSTGLAAIGLDQGSQAANKAKAIELLTEKITNNSAE
jgi:protein subunit release factor A